MTFREFILAQRARLAQAGLECADPLLHAKQIVEAGLGIDSAQLYIRWESSISEAEQARVLPLFERRLTGEPFQYVVGYEYFWKHKFAVGKGCLIPRRETEILLEELLRHVDGPLKIAELGPGTGCIGISALLERRQWEWHAYELNPASLPFVRENARALLPKGVAFHLYEGDFFASAPRQAPFDLLVSNPPYVVRGEMPGLSKEVRSEPAMALDGGESGLEILTRLAQDAKRLLKPNGSVLFEIGSDQGETAPALFEREGFSGIKVLVDYAGLPRVILGHI